MSVTLQQARKWLPILLIGSLVAYMLTGRILSSDESMGALRAFVENDHQIANAVGKVENIKVVKRVAVSATEGAGAYRLYTIDVRGSGVPLTVVVRVEGSSGTERIHLESLRR